MFTYHTCRSSYTNYDCKCLLCIDHIHIQWPIVDIISDVQPPILFIKSASYILALAWGTAMKQNLADSPMAEVYSNLLICQINLFSGSPTMHVVVCSYYVSMGKTKICLLYTSPSPRDATLARMPSSA